MNESSWRFLAMSIVVWAIIFSLLGLIVVWRAIGRPSQVNFWQFSLIKKGS